MHLPHVVPFSQTPLYFLTAGTVRRRPLLACIEAHVILREIWTNSALRDGWLVGRYVLMPDHVHFFAMPSRDATPRARWHKMWKSVSARKISAAMHIAPPVWQADTFDHILRGAESYSGKWDYVVENPVRAGLVSKASDWPRQGEIHALRL